MRKCGNCGKPGHYTPRCTENNNVSAPVEEKEKTVYDVGREILQKQNQVVDRVPDDYGTIPKTGLWLINLERKRIAGKISQVKKNGDILWCDVYGGFVESTPQTIKDGGYLYLELETPHLMFEVVSKGTVSK